MLAIFLMNTCAPTAKKKVPVWYQNPTPREFMTPLHFRMMVGLGLGEMTASPPNEPIRSRGAKISWGIRFWYNQCSKWADMQYQHFYIVICSVPSLFLISHMLLEF